MFGQRTTLTIATWPVLWKHKMRVNRSSSRSWVQLRRFLATTYCSRTRLEGGVMSIISRTNTRQFLNEISTCFTASFATAVDSFLAEPGCHRFAYPQRIQQWKCGIESASRFFPEYVISTRKRAERLLVWSHLLHESLPLSISILDFFSNECDTEWLISAFRMCLLLSC